MKRFSIQALMMKLSVIPGMRFLDKWVTEFNSTRTRIDQRVGDLQHYYEMAGEGISEVGGGFGGNVDPNVDENGNSVASDDDSDFGYSTGDSGRNFSSPNANFSAAPHPVDGLSQNYEDVFYDEGDG